MLARHREKAGAVALAASSYVQAGEAARSRYANAKAAELFARGLHLLEQCDPADEDLRLKALHHHGDVLQALGRNDEAYGAFVEMLTRAWRLDLRSKGGAAHSRIGRLYRETGRLDEASRQLDGVARPLRAGAGRAGHRRHARRHRQAALAQGRLRARARVHARERSRCAGKHRRRAGAAP